MVLVVMLPAARRDVLDQAGYYDAVGGDDLGDRFVAQCQAGFAQLASFPESGARVQFNHPALQDCRFILTPGFEKIIIFYKFSADKIQIVRVLHGARDIEAVLQEGGGDGMRH